LTSSLKGLFIIDPVERGRQWDEQVPQAIADDTPA